MIGLLKRLGGFCARHHWPVIAAWVVAAVGLTIAASIAGERTSSNLSIPGTDSTRAADILDASLPEQSNGNNPVVLEARKGKLTDPSNSKAVSDTVAALRQNPHVVSAPSPLGAEQSELLSKDQKVGYIPLVIDIDPADLTNEEAEQIQAEADTGEREGLDVSISGYVGDELSQPSTRSSEAIGIAAAIIILLFAFGTVTAMGLPIVTAVLGLASALALIELLGHLVSIPDVAATLATMIGLGVGIDYSLFIVTRHKQQLRAGMDMHESIVQATARAGVAVVFAGSTVIVALVSLAAARIPIVTSLGFASAIAVTVAVLAAVTLIPALLGALGPRINSLRVKLGRTHPDDHQPHGWRRWARWVVHRPWRSAIAALVFLGVLAAPVLNLQLGQTNDGTLPTSTTARQSYDALAEGFGPGINAPLLVAVEFDQKETASDPDLVMLERDIAKTPGVVSVSPATVDSQGEAAVFTVISEYAPDSQQTTDLVNELRDTVIPGATKGTDLTAYVGGETAGYIDLADRISERLPSMILIVVALSCVLLLLAFRSVVIPLKAAAMNLISVAAAYGIVTFVFQEGHGAELIGLQGAIPIVSFVPLLMFAILFGLSMDYEVFLVSQIEEHYVETGEPKRAVVDGLANTGRVITSAALIMFCVFASFVLNGDPVVKEFGVGLATAIAIDATVVRCLLVPALMSLLGRASWWLPRWLDRVLPHIDIEGRDQPRAGGS